jgi:stage V sporulation protein D (sporulation-specific penicillin-binding protein)
LENTLKEVGDRWQSKLSGGIIMDPKTGAIYALGVYPSFDPNHYADVSSISLLDNPLIDHVYEMGSIVKPLTMAVGLDVGAVTARTTYNDKGCETFDKKTFCNFDGKGRGTVSMQEVLNQSLNTGASYVVSKIGNRRFADYLKRFGIGEETGIDLPNEGAGIVDNLESPRNIEYATASFGQGFAVTPIAITRALATLANRGRIPSPHVATEVKYRSGLTDEVNPPSGEQVIKEETAEEITRMLVEVVDTALLNGKLKNEHYSIAAKTGTAQIANPQGGGYYDDRYLHSFFGYFPAYDPKFLVFLYTNEPVGVKYSSQTLAEPFKELSDFLINYYALPPDR